MTGFTAWVAVHRRSLLCLLALPVLAGLIMAGRLPVTLFPAVTFPRVRVSLDAGDRPAPQMLLLATRPLEQAVHRVPGVTDVRSTTSRGSAELSITFAWGTDMTTAELQVNAAVGQVLPTLPAGSTATVRRMEPTVFPIIAYSLTSDTLSPTRLRDLAQYQLRPLLASIEGVAEVGVAGGAEQEFQVIADPDRLLAHGLAFEDVVKAVGNASLVQAVGRIEDHYKLFLVVSDNSLGGLDAVRHVVLSSGAGGVVTVGDVAQVVDGTVPQWTRVTAGGRDAVLLNVYQQRDGNSVRIAAAVRDRLAAASLPKGVTVSNWYDQSQLVLASAASVRDAVLIGIVLAALVLWLFLRDVRITLIAALVVPAALAATVALLSVLRLSFNIMTLGGMAAAVGLIIDDAIVMVEHIVRRLREGHGDGGGVLAAAREFTRPLAGSSAATLVIFVPLAFLNGVTGAFFQALSLTMASGLAFSFIITWLAVPLAVERLVDIHKPHGAGRVQAWVDDRYGRLSARLLARPWLALAGLVPLIVLGGLAYRAVGSGFMPDMDEGGFVLDYRSAPGTAITETGRLLHQVDAILADTPDVATWSWRIGAGLGGELNEPNRGDYFVRLKPTGRRDIDEVIAEVRARLAHEVPGLEVEIAQQMEDLIGDLTAVPQPIEVKIFGDDPATVLPTARAVAAALAKVDGVVDIKDGVNPAGDALDIRVDAARAAVEGMDVAGVTAAVADYLQGAVATQLPLQTALATKQVGVRVWVPAAVRTTDTDVANLRLRAPDGHLFPLKRVAAVVPVNGEPEIGQENLQGMVAVTARIEGRDMGSVAADVTALLDSRHLVKAPLRYELGGLYQQQRIAFRGLLTVFAAAVAAVFVLLLFLYESFITALVILVMPLLAAGAVFVGLWLTRTELNITAMMGMTMVVGIVTEVAIFFFSEFESLPADMPLVERLSQAGRNRFRPIAMTTLAAMLTLLPLAFGLGEGAGMQQPLAIAILSGLAVQLPLVLLVMPCLYRLAVRGVRT
ncbi:acriflavin resistance protein [Nitrospirillum viridazoti Y2]|uniref:CzcA family heavy metal efflux pump n=1 Tax=Nitrospirillum amazonense TaxID=28077 RepID=A0A560IK85_9PROT|nr:efflux RND transporter permease subunit [Nitrospirillum amazonense]EGY01186.1 acriflavin resistance protein [Nitrospirillum amazonense Y2]TWB59453.1 CzcA family heavy metal efflux pump [Nitrospirillum amazonense]